MLQQQGSEEAPRTPEQSYPSLFFQLSPTSSSFRRAGRRHSAMAPSSMGSLPLVCRRQERQDETQEPQDLLDFAVTPMTSRPHNCSFLHQQQHRSSGSPTMPDGPPIRRVRSRSLGQIGETAVVSAAWLPRPLKDSILMNNAAITSTVDRNSNGADQVTQQPPDDNEYYSETSKQADNLDDGADVVPTASSSSTIRICIVYGMINATIVLPVLMSFTSIIYRDDAFGAFIPILVKLTVVSGIVHQLCFSTFSSLPFAVGQVQDAGLIFLSGMASTMVQYCQEQSHDNATMIATVTIGLSLATAVLGLGLVGIGYLKLAQRVQRLPTCVVGGYLAFIGWFCGISGIGLMAGSAHVTLSVIQEQFQFVLPGVLGGFAIYTVVTKARHMAALPISIALEIALFYLILWITGTSVSEATNAGWIRKMDAAPSWTHTWDYLRFDLVDWWAYPKLALTEIGMIFVVALSSSLDVAAIDLELKNQPLDYNHELKTVGLSNIISGLTGGYTGSYIFSQSIFSLRAGIRSRVAGFTLAGCQILFVVAPFPILAYVPNYFFGSMLLMICIDLMYEWLWDVRTRLSRIEYFICVATFVFIQVLSVEYGILAGVALHQGCQRLGLQMMNSQYDNDYVEDNAPGDQEQASLLKVADMPRYNSLTTSTESATNDFLDAD